MASLSLHNWNAKRAAAQGDGGDVIRVIRAGDRDHAAFIDQWTALAARAAEPNPFGEAWFVRASQNAYRPGDKVTVVAFHRAGVLHGVMPVEFARSYYGRPMPHLSSWQHDNAFSGTPLVAAGSETAFWRALLTWADRASRVRCFFHISRMAADGPLFAALKRVVHDQGRTAAIVRREARALLQSSLDAPGYWNAALGGKKRKELRRQHRRLTQLGTVEFQRRRDDADLREWTDEFLALEKRGWKGREGSALGCDTNTFRLFHEALRGAATAGRLERLTLTLDAKPIAMLVNFLTAPGAYSYKTAFDEDYAAFSPGVLLQRENLDILGDPAIEWVDSCAGADHPMIDRIWRERRNMVGINVALGGPVRRALFERMVSLERHADRISGA
ncbi:MAG: GNAT family N-acetyltransferase [Pontixanthobacter sp.]